MFDKQELVFYQNDSDKSWFTHRHNATLKKDIQFWLKENGIEYRVGWYQVLNKNRRRKKVTLSTGKVVNAWLDERYVTVKGIQFYNNDDASLFKLTWE